MKQTVVLIPGVYPKASESIFKALRKSLAETDYEVLVLENADEEDLASKAGTVKSKILIGRSYGGNVAIEYQLKRKDAKALVLLAPAVKVKDQFREIKVAVLIVHGTEDRVICRDSMSRSRIPRKGAGNCKNYSGLDKFIALWLAS